MTDCKNLDLAREWAEWMHDNPDVYGGTSDRARAAADLISSLPDEWVSADELREVVADHHIDMSEGLVEALGALLPAPTPPTLADMTPEERAECQWMQAEVDGRVYEGRAVITDIVEAEGKAKTILPSGQQFSFHISIVTPLPELPRMQWPGSEPEETHFDDLPDEVKQVMEESVEDYKAGRFVDFDTPESPAPRTMAEIEWDDAEASSNKEAMGESMADFADRIFGRLPVGEDLFDHVNRTSVENHQERVRAAFFNPAYTYRDCDGDIWERIDGGWVSGPNHEHRRRARGFEAGAYVPPAEYGPYTRIEDTNE